MNENNGSEAETPSGSKRRFDEVWDFHDGRALVRQGWQYFYIDEDQNPISEELYDWGDDFQDGRAQVMLRKKRFHIDRCGNRIG